VNGKTVDEVRGMCRGGLRGEVGWWIRQGGGTDGEEMWEGDGIVGEGGGRRGGGVRGCGKGGG